MARAAKTKTVSPAAGTQAALWRTAATGRQLSSLAGGSRGRRVSDAPGGRRHQHGALSVFRRRDDLGSGGGAAGLERTARGGASAPHPPQEPVRAVGGRA